MTRRGFAHPPFPGAVRLVPTMLLAAALLGGLVCWWLVGWTDREQRQDLMQQAQLVAQAIDLRALRPLQGQPSDLSQAEYQRLKSQLVTTHGALPKCRFLYLLGQRPDGTVFLFADSEPVGSADYSPPGQAYPEASDVLRGVFGSGRGAAEGPLDDRWGTWVSALVPLDGTHGAARVVLGLDVDARDWRRALLTAGLPPALLALILLALLVAGSVRRAPEGRPGKYSDPARAFAAGLAATLYVVWICHYLEPHNRHSALASLAAARAAAVTEALRDLGYAELESLASFYEGSEEVNTTEFAAFCQFLSTGPRVRAWHWVPVVPAAERAAFEAEARAAGESGFAIWEQAAGPLTKRPARPRSTYYPVRLVTPPRVAPLALGLDFGADPVTLAALQEAARSGLTTATGTLQVPGSGADRKGILLFRPVCRRGLPGQPRGFVVAMLSLRGLLHPTTSSPLLQLSLLRADGSRELLATSGADTITPPDGEAARCPIFAFGNVFLLTAHQDAAFLRLYPTRAGLLSAVAGLLLSLAVAAAVAAARRRRDELERLVAARTAELQESEERLEQLAEQSGTITWEMDVSGVYSYVSPVVAQITGYAPQELTGRVRFFDHYPDAEREQLAAAVSARLMRHEPFVGLEVPLVGKDGRVRWLAINGIPRFGADGEWLGYRGAARDVSARRRADAELRLNEQRTTALLELSQMSDEPETAISDFALERALTITDSRLGYLAFVSDDETVLTMCSWSRSALAACRIQDKPLVYPLAETGLWGEPVRQRRPIITNDYAAEDPLKRGLPEGHVALTRHLGVPLFDGGRIALIVGVGNKAEPYSDDDVRQLALLADGLWKVLQAKRGQEALRAAEANYRNFIETMVDAIVVVSLSSRVLFTNPAGAALLGAEHPEDLIGRDMKTILVPEYHALHAVRMRSIAGAPTPLAPVETTVIRLDGVPVPVEILSSGCRFNGETAVQAVLRDLRSREQAERIHQLYELLARHTHDLILFVHEDGRLMEANQAALEAYGYTRDELLALTIRDLRAAETLHTLDEQMREARDAVRFETMHRRRDGTVFPVEVSSRGVTIDGQRALLSIVRDITERRLAEQRAAEQSRMLDAILTASPVGITLVRDRVLVWTNQALERMLGYASAELVGESTAVIYGADPEWNRVGTALDSGALGARTAEADGIVMRRGGGKLDCHFFARLLTPHDPSRGYIIVLTDMTERRRAEEANRLASVGQLAAGVAHDFNNLLTSMLMTATLAEMGAADCSRLIEVVRKSARSGADITASLMTFARPDEPRRQEGQIEETLEAALGMAARQLANAEVAVCRDYARQPRPLIFDPTQMEQVFLNLIINACHAMAGGGTLTVRTSYPAAGAAAGQAVVEVSDTGVGIPPEHLDRIFEPFFTTKGRLGESDTPGSGLGLSVSHGLVAAHGGTITVTSRPGEGSTFRVGLPLASPDAALPPAAVPDEAALPADQIDLNGARILVADDEEDVLVPLGMFLHSSGGELTTAPAAATAIEALRGEHFDLVISDLMMPGGGGRAVLEYCASLGSEAPPVIMMTGRLEPALHEEVLALGASRCIQKPFDMHELLVAIQELLAARRR